tara:strand:- start:811 stop:1164 length:354 start_codon:yes stop_codon:yes gene_type:complete
MRDALEILDSKPRDFVYEGEMNSDTALDADLRQRYFPDSRLEGEANVLVFANTDAASGVRNILKAKAQALEVGPILMGMGNRAHIVTSSITARLSQYRRTCRNPGPALRLTGCLEVA